MAWDQRRRPASEYLHPAKRRRILDAHHATCHVCHHGDADHVDHVTPWAEWTRLDLSVHDASNLAPIHGDACPTCAAHCHDDKSKREAARGSSRRAAKARRPVESHPGMVTP